MLLLTSTSDKIQLITSAACAVSVHAAYVDKLADVFTPLRTNTLITTATTTDIVPAPAASTERNVQMLAVVNTHASTAVTVTVQHTDGTNVVRLYQKILQPGEELFVGMTTLLLTSDIDKLRLVSAGAALSLSVYVAFVENDAGTITPGRQNTLITTATTTDILASPAAAKQRNVQFVSVFNAHATERATISITHTDGTNEVVVFRAVLLPGQAIRFVEGDEFKPASVIVSATAPIGVADDVLWWNSTTGILNVLYNDGTSQQWVQVTASLPAHTHAPITSEDFLINGNGQVDQAALTGVADGVFGHDQWYALTQTAAIEKSTQSDVANGLPKMIRLSQAQVTAQRMGYAQMLTASQTKKLRGQTVTFGGKFRNSNGGIIGFAVLEGTWTADAPSAANADFMQDWTSTLYQVGDFFKATNTNLLGHVLVNPGASNTLANFSLTVNVGTSANNLMVYFWTAATFAQNATLDVACQLKPGAEIGDLIHRPYEEDLIRSRFFWRLVARSATGASESTTRANINDTLQPPMFKAPTVAIVGTIKCRHRLAITLSANSPTIFASTTTDGWYAEITASSWSPENMVADKLSALICDPGNGIAFNARLF